MRLTRRIILLAPLLLTLIACGETAQLQPFTPASDRPTFIFFYAQG